MKGQPLAYNRDNQEDKEPLFDSARTLKDCLKAWRLLAEGMRVNAQRMEMALQQGHMNATRLADYLTEKGLPFRKSYELAGQAVRLAKTRGVNLQELSLAQLQQLSPLIKEDLFLDYPRLVASYDLPRRQRAASRQGGGQGRFASNRAATQAPASGCIGKKAWHIFSVDIARRGCMFKCDGKSIVLNKR